jgi:FlaA1/EpsC-like NDP-sugar epimerase
MTLLQVNLLNRKESIFRNDFFSVVAQKREEIENSVFLVLGAAGSIGSNFIKKIVELGCSQLILVDQNENDLTNLLRNLRTAHVGKKLELKIIVGSIGDYLVQFQILNKSHFTHVANFAAAKHVRAERNIFDALRMLQVNCLYWNDLINIFKRKSEITSIFSVSTDKAADPINIMGASKRIMESILLDNNRINNPYYTSTTIFANVLML